MKTVLKLFLAMLFLIFLQQVYAQNNAIRISGALKGLGNKAVWVSFSDDAGLSRSFKSNAVNDHFSMNVPRQKKGTVANLNIAVVQEKRKDQKPSNQGILKLLIGNQNISVSGEASDLKEAKIGYTNQ